MLFKIFKNLYEELVEENERIERIKLLRKEHEENMKKIEEEYKKKTEEYYKNYTEYWDKIDKEFHLV